MADRIRASDQQLEVVVPPSANHERLDRFLTDQLPGRSRSQIQQLVRQGRVWVNGRPSRPGTRLAVGDRVLVELPPPEPPFEIPPAAHLRVAVLYADDWLLAVDKPAGMVVHPAPGHHEDTLVNALVGRYPDLLVQFPDQRPGIVHRLDRETSGVLVVARTPAVAESLKRQFRQRTVRKVYLALVKGAVSPPAGIVDAPVARDSRHRQRMTVDPAGRPSRTAYRALATSSAYSWLVLEPETGRSHQIRVHLAAIGHPVAGDRVYGRRDRHIDHLALHAWQLEVDHPQTGERIRFVAPLPADLEAAVERLFGGVVLP